MPWINSHRAALAAAVAVPSLLTVWAAGPARAHGAPTDPVSRVYACSPEGGAVSRSAACRAAVAANGAPFTAWDNLRIANVNGRDRQVVPDGGLCSGGLPAYRGLDLARSDWPSTRLTPGATLTMRYSSTIPHTGTFQLYLTKAGYDPSKPLTWSDLPDRPFASVKDPALTNGAYRITAKLPSDRSGRHVLYTVWRNTSTPDTYYSCSDVEFPAATAGGTGGAGAAGPGSAAKRTPDSGAKPTGKASASASPTASATEAAGTAGTAEKAASGAPRAAEAPAGTPVASTGTSGTGASAPLVAGGAAGALLLTGGAALALRLRRR